MATASSSAAMASRTLPLLLQRPGHEPSSVDVVRVDLQRPPALGNALVVAPGPVKEQPVEAPEDAGDRIELQAPLADLGRLIMPASNGRDVGQMQVPLWIARAQFHCPSGLGLRAGPVPVVEDMDQRHRAVRGRNGGVEIERSRGAGSRLRDHRGGISDTEYDGVEAGLGEVAVGLRKGGIEVDRAAEARNALREVLRT